MLTFDHTLKLTYVAIFWRISSNFQYFFSRTGELLSVYLFHLFFISAISFSTGVSLIRSFARARHLLGPMHLEACALARMRVTRCGSTWDMVVDQPCSVRTIAFVWLQIVLSGIFAPGGNPRMLHTLSMVVFNHPFGKVSPFFVLFLLFLEQ